MIRSAAVAALVFGVLAPGCARPASDSRGRFCAAPDGGDAFCVPSAEGPAAAWRKAEARGHLPIQMWAEWPSDVTLDALVASGDALNTWFGDIDKVVAYVRDTKKNAESYKASLAGNLGALLRQAKDRQAALLAEKPVDAIGSFQQALSDKASAVKDPLIATIASDKQAMSAAQAVFDKARGDAMALQTAFASIATEFTAYRASEAVETAAYASLAAQASVATLATINDVEQAILMTAEDASKKPSDLTLGAMKLSAQIQAFELASEMELAPHKDFLATHGAALPDMTSAALRSLNAMLGYTQQRVARSDATALSLLSGVAMRKLALGMLASAGQSARDTVASARLRKARDAFQAGTSVRLAALAAAPETSSKLKLPYLARRYDELTALLQMQPLCDPSSASWREQGCTSLRERFSAAEAYRKTTLPALIATDLAAMRAAGADAALLDAAQAKLAAGDIKGAVMLHDAAVHSAEGT